MDYEKMDDAALDQLAAEKIMGYKRTVGWADQYNIEGWYHPSRPKEIILHRSWHPTAPGSEAQAFMVRDEIVKNHLEARQIFAGILDSLTVLHSTGRDIVIAALKAVGK